MSGKASIGPARSRYRDLRAGLFSLHPEVAHLLSNFDLQEARANVFFPASSLLRTVQYSTVDSNKPCLSALPPIRHGVYQLL